MMAERTIRKRTLFFFEPQYPHQRRYLRIPQHAVGSQREASVIVRVCTHGHDFGAGWRCCFDRVQANTGRQADRDTRTNTRVFGERRKCFRIGSVLRILRVRYEKRGVKSISWHKELTGERSDTINHKPDGSNINPIEHNKIN